jgi:hypothetical protein
MSIAGDLLDEVGDETRTQTVAEVMVILNTYINKAHNACQPQGAHWLENCLTSVHKHFGVK